MSLVQKVQAVQEVFSHLEHEMAKFQAWSSLACKSGCNKCCLKPGIEASVLEFLPFAHYLYENDLALGWLERCEGKAGSLCILYDPAGPGGSAGACSQYPYRALVCRLFGFSARTDKYGSRELTTCQVIKTGQPETVAEAVTQIKAGAPVPVMNQYYMRLHAIDRDMMEFFPINEAIRRAIETVLQYYAYRN